ncbi:HTH CENPB-type domain-containing protein [Meloidogyne graminicola]|uniref:HTH CENPB-type domain-containing protein n=1 Tax=Meloidogyne graminicola TaxID=189291 RepID=A0A8T0A264_9BILA|nr:HTH CENPB-type domain-containing protein [Meloidogyne graminicola]
MRNQLHYYQKKKSYTVDFKLEVVEFSRNFSPSEAGKRFNVDRRRIRDWTHQEDKLKELRNSTPLHIQKRRLTGAGRHLHNVEFEKDLLEWIKEKQTKGEPLSRRIIKVQASQMSSNYPECFEASEGWLQKFLKRNNISCQRPTTTRQENAEYEKELFDLALYLQEFINNAENFNKV